jgi:hypothetical protein
VSGVLLLCILSEEHVPGMDIAAPGQPIASIHLAPLTLWIRHAAQAPAPTLEDVRAHHRVVTAAWERCPAVLPVRYGQWFGSEEELRAAVGPKVDAYERALERVRGAAEFSIRVLDPALEADPQERPASGSGTDYLRAAAARARRRSEADARGRAVAAELGSALGALVREERLDPADTPHGLVGVAHLVARADERAYEQVADRFAAERPGLRFLRTGPWPAWSFTA